jgi:hypothetical protein
MAEDRWRRAAVPTEEAALSALRLAEEYSHDELVRRDRSDGAIEVAALKDGRFTHYLVHGDGTVELLEKLGPTARHRWGKRLGAAAVLVWTSIFFAGFAFSPDNSTLWISGAFFLGWLLLMAGVQLDKGQDLEAYLRSRTGSADGWTELPYKLGGWPVRSSRQLEAVRELSDQGQGDAYVRARDDGSVEVVTTRRACQYTHVVDPVGDVVDEQRNQISGARRWSNRYGWAGFVLFAVSAVLLNVSTLIGVAGMTLCVLVWLAGWLRERQRRVGRNRDGWFLVETAEPSD